MSIDMTTRYLGLELSSPVIAAPSPLTGDSNRVLQLEAAGVGAIVLPSLFEEQVAVEDSSIHCGHPTSFANWNGRRPGALYRFDMTGYNNGPDGCLQRIELFKRELRIPVIASLNCSTRTGWVRFAKLFEQAGADALELNLYIIPADARRTPRQVEDAYVDIVSAVAETISIPLAIKLTPFFTSLPYFANRLVDAGARGLVLFNRFTEPTLDLEKFEVVPRIDLSSPCEQRLPLRWIATLHHEIAASLSATTGFHTGEDVIRAIAAGADTVQIAAAFLQHGPQHAATVIAAMKEWLASHDHTSIQEVRGLMAQSCCPDPTVYERSNYIQSISGFSSS